MCMCVCVCVRERERERERTPFELLRDATSHVYKRSRPSVRRSRACYFRMTKIEVFQRVNVQNVDDNNDYN